MNETSDNKLFLTLSSGQNLLVNKLKLYPKPKIDEMITLKSQAQESMGGFSTGVAFLGSPGMAIGSAAALTAIESIVTGSKEKKGLQLLKQANKMYRESKEAGCFFDIKDIQAIISPDPSDWQAQGVAKLTYDLSSMGMMERAKFIAKHKIDREAASKSTVKISKTVRFIYDGDPFIWLEADGKPIAARWDSVVSYQLIN